MTISVDRAAYSTRPRKGKRLTRQEKSQLTHDALMKAAAVTVGEQGYADTMVSTITARANVAQGTFYNYFESKQELFERLLPELGREMLSYIRERTLHVETALEREELSFRAFFEFLERRPEFYRILYEAELFVPTAFRDHMDTIARGYIKFLRSAWKKGELNIKDESELEPTSYMLMGIRHYLCMQYARQDNKVVALPEQIVGIYKKMITNGMFVAER
ncbi:MAG: helix-turn-helix domain-containing protein [Burkholderiaceae bacterium]